MGTRHEVLPEARLGFVETERSPLAQRSAVQRLVDSEFIEGVPALVDTAQEAGYRQFPEHFRRDADIVQPEARCKRMRTHILPSAREIVSHPDNDAVHKFKLFPFIIFRMEKRVVNLFAGSDLFQQSDLFFAERRKDGVHFRHRISLLEIVEQGIIDVLIRAEQFRIFAPQVDQGRQIRLKDREIGLLFRFRPRMMGFRGGTGGSCDKRRRNPRSFFKIPPEFAAETHFHGIRRHGCGLSGGGVNQSAEFRGGCLLMRELCQSPDLPGTVGCGIRRHIRLLIPFQQSHCCMKIRNLRHGFLQSVEMFHHHACPCFSK